MIVSKKTGFRKAVLYSWREMIFFAALSFLVFYLYDILGFRYLTIPFTPLGVMGTALAFFLAFRNNTSYDRWWEARKIWGGIVNYSRSWGRQMLTLFSLENADIHFTQAELKAFQKAMIYRQIAWINALRMHLREQNDWDSLAHLLPAEELEAIKLVKNKPAQLVMNTGKKIKEAYDKGLLDSFKHTQIDNSLSEFYNLQGKCERIANTPHTPLYDFFTRAIVWIFVTLLPFSLVGELAELSEKVGDVDLMPLVIPFSMLISFVFVVLKKLGSNIEDPFLNGPQDTPMSALCISIEVDLREMLGEKDLPEPQESVRGILH